MDDLTPAQLHELRDDLQALTTELAQQVGQSTEGSKPVDLDQPIGRLSRMDAMQQQAMARAGRERAKQRLRQVEGALRRLEAGEYGECIRCDDPIAFGRLKVRPETPTCLRCQAEIEGSR